MNDFHAMRPTLRPARAPWGRRSRFARHAAFSLVELIFVMLIIGVLATMAAPRFSTAMAHQQVGGAARRVVADLALARQEARLHAASRTVQFNTTTDQYTLIDVSNPNGTTDDYIVNLAGEPYNAGITSADFGGDTTVIFDAYGNPDSDGTVVVRVGRFSISVTLEEATGKAAIDSDGGTPIDVGDIAIPDTDPGADLSDGGSDAGDARSGD